VRDLWLGYSASSLAVQLNVDLVISCGIAAGCGGADGHVSPTMISFGRARSRDPFEWPVTVRVPTRLLPPRISGSHLGSLCPFVSSCDLSC
jgi:hypothetical protein